MHSQSLPTNLEWHMSGPLRHYLTESKSVTGLCDMALCRQPAGDMSDPPLAEFVLIEIQTAGIRSITDFGAGRSRDVVPAKSFALIAPSVATKILVDDPHTIRTLSFARGHIAKTLQDCGASRFLNDFGSLHRGYFKSQLLSGVLESMWSAASIPDDTARLFLESALQLVGYELAQLGGATPPRRVGGLTAWQTRRVIEAIDAAGGLSLSLDQLAELAGLSPFHFCRAFKVSLGLSPHQFQMVRRIDRARVLLSDTKKSITEIALDTGYDSSQALARAFRREVGVSPNEYRAILRS